MVSNLFLARGKNHLELKLRDHVRPDPFNPFQAGQGAFYPAAAPPTQVGLDEKCAKKIK